MDADDVLAPASGPELRRLVCQHPDRNVAFTAQVRLPAGVGFANEGVVDHIKLFPNRPELRFQFRDHQQILPALCRAGMRALPSSLTITHQHRDASLDARDGRRRRHVRLLDLDLHENPEHPYILYHLGDTHLHMTREYEVAVQYLQRCLKSASWRDDTLRLAHGALTAVYMAQEDWDAALAANEEGRSHFPDDPVMLLQAGQLYQQLGRWDEARRALERLVLGYDEPEYRCGEVGLRTYRGRHELALLRWRQGQLRHCEQSLREVAATYPSYLPARLHWVGALCAMGQTEEARQHLDLIPTAPGFELELQRLREQVGACAC
jgi:tetratricopeptide (TPR) repeat protein